MAISLLFHLPVSYTDRLAIEGEIRQPATFEQYLEFAEECGYRVEYSNGNIISMGQPTDAHELICGNVITAFNNLLEAKENFRVYGSNLGIYIRETEAHYKPDVSILGAAPEYILHKVRKRTLKSILNPFAIFEVFSDGTMDYDMTEKLPNYKHCPSLQYIIYIHQHKPFVTVHTRSEQPAGWLSEEFIGLDAAFQFEREKILLQHLYRKVIFSGNGKKKSKK